MPASQEFEQDVQRVASLADTVRGRLYRFVVSQPFAVGRDEAAHGVGVARHIAKFHLDKLVAQGLLDTEFRRLTDRTGPGAGRPAKLYRRSDRTVSVTLPDRQYELAGAVLAAAVVAAEQDGSPVADAIHQAALERGRAIGRSFSGLIRRTRSKSARTRVMYDALGQCGYEPSADGTSIVLRNCPFHNLAQSHTELVCGMNLDLLVGLAEGMELKGVTPRLDPSPGRCCVRIKVD